jgi:long-chain acyl-CoA synthetase
MTVSPTLVARVLERGRSTPDALALLANRRGRWRTTTAGELADRVGSVALAMSAAGVQAGDRVAVAIDHDPDGIVADLAAQLVGAISIVVPTSGTDRSLMTLLADVDASTVFVVDELIARDISIAAERGTLPGVRRVYHGGDGTGGTIGVDDLAASVDARAEDVERLESARRLDDVVSATFSDGSGGVERIVLHDAAAVAGGAVEVVEAYGLVPEDVTVVAFPMSHPFERSTTIYPSLWSGAVLAYPETPATYGRAVREIQPTFAHLPVDHLRGIAAGVHHRFRRNSGLKRPVASWWRRSALAAAEQHRWPGALSRFVVGRPVLRTLGLSRLRAAIVTGENAPSDVLVTLTALGLRVRTGYASVEAGLVAIGEPVGDRHLVPIGATSVTVVDGRLAIDAVGVARCYLDGSPIARAGERAVDTGDLGEVHADGFVVVGPAASVMPSSDGTPVVAADLERRLRDSPYIGHAVVTVGERIHADIAIDRDAVADWATDAGLTFTTLVTLVALEPVRQLLAAEVDRLLPEVEHHDLLNRPLQQGREITRTGRVIYRGQRPAGVDPTTADRDNSLADVD